MTQICPENITLGDSEVCFQRTCHVPKELKTVLLFLGPELRMYIHLLNHYEPQNNLLTLTSNYLVQQVKNHKMNNIHSSLPRHCHFTSAKMCSQVEKTRGTHSLNSKCQTSMPLYQVAKEYHDPALNGASVKAPGRHIVTVLEARASLYTKSAWE